MSAWALVWRLARRDLRGGAAGLAVLVGCLALGVAAVGGIGSLSAGIRAALAADARAVLGGDLSIERAYRPLAPEARGWIAERAEATGDSVRMRAMAAAPVSGAAPALVELKAVDSAWPLYGDIALAPAPVLPLAEALAGNGAVADPALLERLGLAVGGEIAVGEARFTVRAVIEREPDRLSSGFALGPRLTVPVSALEATGLVRPGAVVRHFHKVRLPPGADLDAFTRALGSAFPDADWRVRRSDQAQPGLRRLVDRLGLYLTLIGLAALLVGGIGVASAAHGHVASRLDMLATLKCLGAAPATAFRVAMLETMLLALPGIALGLAAGAALPWALRPALAEHLDVAVGAGVHAGPLALAALYGGLTAALFSLWPVARASRVSPGGLLRHRVAMPEGPPPRAFQAAAAVLAGALALVVFLASGDRAVSAWFVGGAAASLGVLALAAAGIARAARRLARGRRGVWRLALASLGRPGSAAPRTVPAIGIGLSVLVAVALVESNMRRTIDERLRADAPAFFLIDIQRGQAAPLEALVEALPQAGSLELAPMLRGRLAEINGKPVAEADLPPEARWLARGDIGLSFAADPPARDAVAAGEWWPADHDGPPLVSFDEESALSAGLGVGDRVAFRVLGRPVEAEIANLRRVSWNRIALNFVVVYAPGALDSAPYTLVGSVNADPAAEAPLVRALARDFANVSAVPVRDLLAAAERAVRAIAAAIGLTAAAALAAGVLVMAGAVAADRAARLRDSAVLKVLGATRATVLAAWSIEFALVGAVAGGLALAAGGLAAWGFVHGLLDIEWHFPAVRALAAVAAGAALTTLLGFAGTWRVLGRKPASILRTP